MIDISEEKYRVLTLTPFHYYVVLISSEEEWDTIKGELECAHEDWLSGGAACVRDRSPSSIVCLNPSGELSDYVEYICHEATHCFQNMCTQIGEPNPSYEFEAYYIGHIAGWLLNHTLEQYLQGQENE